MRVFLTGITGFLGSHAAEALLAAGHEVVALARRPDAVDRDIPRSERLRLVPGSLSDEAVLRASVDGCEAVVHIAGLIQSRTEAGYMAVNRDGCEAMLRAVESAAPRLRRFVLVSSQAAGGPSRNGRPVTGEDEAAPISAYGRSKRAGELRALERAARLPVTILRPPVIFGARDRMLEMFFKSVERGRAAVWGRGTNAFNVVHAPDVALAMTAALAKEHASGSVLYTSDDRVLTWRSFIQTLADTAGARVRIYPIPPVVFTGVAAGSTLVSLVSGAPPKLSWDKLAELREPAWICSSARTREVLGWSPSTSIEQALAATHRWYKARGLL